MKTSTPDGAHQRAGVAKAVNAVINDNRTIDWILEKRPKWTPNPSAVDQLYGVMRYYFSLKQSVDKLLKKPLRSKDSDIYALMLVGAYQLGYARIQDYASINETVEACNILRKPWAKGVVNAVLRGWENPKRSFDHPAWLIDAISCQYGDLANAILFANNDRAPMTLRVNARLISADKYAEQLAAAAIASEPGLSQNSLLLKKPQPVESLPGWHEGLVAVQDLAAQYTAELALDQLLRRLSPKVVRVLDACVAPGGKMAHLFELISTTEDAAGRFEILGIDCSKNRLDQTRKILQRLGHLSDEPHTGPSLALGDATGTEWWDGQPFDHILVDAPCSGTGTIRRHPDIKLLLKQEQISQHAQLQRMILHNLWQTLAPGGTLLYCTCSLLKEENDDVVEEFLQHCEHAESAGPIELPSGSATRFGWQTLPTDVRTDGFYFALLRNTASAKEGP